MARDDGAPERSAEIMAVLDALKKGLHDRNSEAVMALYAKDAVIYDLDPPLAQTPDEAHIALWLSSWGGPITRTTRDVAVKFSGNTAVLHGLTHMSAPMHNGEMAAWWMRTTMLIEKHDAGWLIAHEHNSVPFYMDGSSLAALDLVP